MDKENVNPIVDSQSGDCEFVASVLDASEAAAGGAALAATAGASEAAAGDGQIQQPEWNPYEKVSYIYPSNPYDTCMDDPWNEVTTVPHSPFLFQPYFCWFPSNY